MSRDRRPLGSRTLVRRWDKGALSGDVGSAGGMLTARGRGRVARGLSSSTASSSGPLVTHVFQSAFEPSAVRAHPAAHQYPVDGERIDQGTGIHRRQRLLDDEL